MKQDEDLVETTDQINGLSEQGKYLIHVQILLLSIESALQLRVAESPYHWNEIVHTQPQYQY